MVAYYREVGFLPAGVLNALGRLGWSLDDETEHFSLADLKQHFSLDRVVKASASLDADKLLSYQQHWMQHLPADEKLAGCEAVLVQAGLLADSPTDADRTHLQRVLDLAGERVRVFGEILSLDEFFVAAADLEYSEKDFQKRLVKDDAATGRLQALKPLLQATDFSAEALHDVVQNFVEDQEIKFGAIAPALRIAVTGKAKGADLFPTLALLGPEECTARIDRAIQLAAG